MKLFTTVLALLALPYVIAMQESPPGKDGEADATGVVTRLYDLVTFDAGTTPDWERVRALFLDEAVVVLRTGRDEMSVFSVDGFVDDFVAFIEEADVEKTGFTERILGMKSFVYGDIAHVLVLFESHIPGSGRDPHEGIDSFELIRREGRWQIASITNERPTEDNPIPESVFE